MNIEEEMRLHQWAQDMADQKASGLSQKKWASMKGIGVSTFRHRCKRVLESMEEKTLSNGVSENAMISSDNSIKSTKEEETFFAKVNLTSQYSNSSGINIRIHDAQVNISSDAPESHIRIVLEALVNA